MRKAAKAQLICDELRVRILFSELRPGALLAESALAEEFGVSRTPVRQALQRLEDQGLVEIRDGVGSFVTPVDARDMEDAYEIRRVLEKAAVRTAAANMAPDELDALRRRFEAFLRRLESGAGVSRRELAFADWELHDMIVERSDNGLIPAATERVTPILRRYQTARAQGQMRATREHLALIACLREGDVEGAQRVLDAHLRIRPEED